MSLGFISWQLRCAGQYILWNVGQAKCPLPPLTAEEIERICANALTLEIDGKRNILRDALEVQNITERALLLAAGNYFTGSDSLEILLNCLRDNHGDMQGLLTQAVIRKAMENLDKRNELAKVLLDHAANAKQKDIGMASWQMTRSCAILIAANCTPMTVRRAISLMHEDFIATGLDIYSICDGARARESGEANAVIGVFLDNMPSNHKLDVNSNLVRAALRVLDGLNLTRLLDRAADPEWKNPTWNYDMCDGMFWNEEFAPEVFCVVLDRFRDIDVNEGPFFLHSMDDGYAHIKNDHDFMAIQLLQRYRDQIIHNETTRNMGIQYGGPLVVMEILKNKGDGEEGGYDIREQDLEYVVWNKTCGLQILTTLLDEVPDLAVSQEVLRTAAAYNRTQGIDIVKVLLKRSSVQLTEEILMGALQNDDQSETLLPFLLENCPGSMKLITTATLKNRRVQWYSSNIIPGLRVLVNHPAFDLSIIDTSLLVLVAEKGYIREFRKENALSILLDVVTLTQVSDIEELACAAMANTSNSLLMLQTLLDRVPADKIPVTPKMLEAAARARNGRTKILKDLVNRDSTVGITQTTIDNACWGVYEETTGNKGTYLRYESKLEQEEEKLEQPTDAIEFLLQQFPGGPKPTTASLANAARSDVNADKMLNFLFENFPDIEVTEEVMIAAAIGYLNPDKKVIQILEHASATPLTMAFFMTCAKNTHNRKKIFEWLYPRLETLNVDEQARREITPEFLANL